TTGDDPINITEGSRQQKPKIGLTECPDLVDHYNRSFEQQRYRASGLNLVTAAIVLWNTVYLERATSALRAHCKALDDTLLQYLSPLGWEHINLTGDYLWRSSAKVGAGKFRPLRPLPPA
ncbi:Tn3 family transposase, partial [Aeromonas hydrophila]|uniref:Tn3 family transposase n=1 Tax=Aeromonas hydrophila TaxID=644 RepID=UPI003EC62B83